MSPRTAWSFMVGVGGLLLVAALIIVLIINRSGATSDALAVLLTLVFCLAGGGLAVASAQRSGAVCGQPRVAWRLAAVGIAAATGWSLLALGGLTDLWFKAEGVAALLAAASGTATVLWLVGTIGLMQLASPTISPGLRRFRRIAVGMLALSGAGIVGAAWMACWFMLSGALPNGVFRVLLSILTVIGGWGFLLGLAMCGSATGVGLKMERKRSRRSETVDADARLRFACPGCGDVSEKPRGPHRCDACGTRVRVRIEEPRCLCGYALFRLAGDRCPECGMTVPDADRYGVQRFDAANPPEVEPGEPPMCACGYDLRELAADQCPECGAEVPGISGTRIDPQPSPAVVVAAPASPAETESSTSDEPPPT